jgi:phage replication O-like protein O
MANPQAENGHTDVANEIMEALARQILSPDEWHCLIVILRKTWGWHKREDRISLSQFALMTGMRKPHICRALKKLFQRQIITQTGNERINIYRFQKDFEKWIPLPKQVIVTRSGNKSLPKQGTTKETKQKKNTLRDPPNPAIKEFFSFFCDSFNRKFGEKYTVNGGKEGQLIKRMLKVQSLDTLKLCAKGLFESNDPYIQKAGYTIGILYSQINKLITEGKSRW